MAILILAVSTSGFDGLGGRRRAERLEQKLGVNYLLWQIAPIDPKQSRPDLAVLNATLSLLDFETKKRSVNANVLPIDE